jgi:simple sugar transport system permease protein
MFNIGASGQYMVGQCAALYVAFYGQSLGGIQWVVAAIAGILAGALWGFFVGLFKALFNVNEVITAIMFNYIGLNLVNILIRGNTLIYNLSKARSYRIPAGARIPDFGLQKLFTGSSVDIGIIIAILIAIALYIVLNKTTFGYELKAVGLNRNASRYAGINDKKSIILSMSIAGALAGLGGALQILSPGVITAGKSLGKEYTPTDVLTSEGFNGIPVALLGLSNPIGIIFSAIFVTYLQRGGYYLQSLNYPFEIIDIIIAIIIYFSAFAILMRNILASALAKRKEKKALEEMNTNRPDIDNEGAV